MKLGELIDKATRATYIEISGYCTLQLDIPSDGVLSKDFRDFAIESISAEMDGETPYIRVTLED